MQACVVLSWDRKWAVLLPVTELAICCLLASLCGAGCVLDMHACVLPASRAGWICVSAYLALGGAWVLLVGFGVCGRPLMLCLRKLILECSLSLRCIASYCHILAVCMVVAQESAPWGGWCCCAPLSLSCMVLPHACSVHGCGSKRVQPRGASVAVRLSLRRLVLPHACGVHGCGSKKVQPRGVVVAERLPHLVVL
jgi:hypothetical protein